MKNKIFFIGIALVLLSCNAEMDKVENTTIPTGEGQEYIGTTSFIFKGSSVYSKFFDDNIDRETAFYSTKANVNERSLVSIDKSNVDQSQTRSSTAEKFAILANGIDLSTIGTLNDTRSGGSTSGTDGMLANLFGKEITFTVGYPAQTRSTSSPEVGVNMYIPHIIDIIYPVASRTELQPLCPYDDLLVEWNKDGQNDNGVVVMVEWDGDMVGQDFRNEGVRTIDVVEDTGRAILDTSMFDGIPDFAMINITLLRGNIDIVELENSAVKLYGVSNSSITVVLAKEPI